MEKTTRIWLIIAVSALLLGGIVFCGAMTAANWDFGELSADKYTVNEYTIEDAFQNISIVTDTADVTFVSADSPRSSVLCHELETMKHSVYVANNTLVIEITDTRSWYDYIGIHFGTPKITLSLPGGDYGSLTVLSSTGDTKIPADFSFESTQIVGSTGDVTTRASSKNMEITTSTGDIRIENVSADSMVLSVSTGDTELASITCRSILSKGDTGELSMEHVIVTETLSIQRTTGDVEFSDCDAAEIFIETDTGDVEGSLLSEKVFLVETETGHVRVPRTTTGGKCEITTSTGDIEITVE